MRISTIGKWNSNEAGSKGYTLLELIAVMALIGIFLGISVPKLRETLFSSNLKSAVRTLKGCIEELRTEAVREHEDICLNIDVDSNSYRVISSGMTDKEKEEVTPIKLPSGVDLARVDFADRKVTVGSAAICFSKRGYVLESLIHLTDKSGAAFTILIRTFLPNVKIENR